MAVTKHIILLVSKLRSAKLLIAQSTRCTYLPSCGLSTTTGPDHHQAMMQLGDLVELENLQQTGGGVNTFSSKRYKKNINKNTKCKIRATEHVL